MGRTLPTFLIIGAAKSGTSSLWHYLKAHPDVYVPEEKELNFFNEDRIFARGVDWYASHFATGTSSGAAGEASPSYLFSDKAHARMAEVVPRARLIAILRNPIDRAYSHYHHARFYGMEQRSFREAVEEERRAPDGRRWPFYLAHSRYHPQLVHLTGYFPRPQLLVLLLDDLTADPVDTFQELCMHVGVDGTTVPSNVGDVTNTYRESRATPLVRFLIRPALGGRIPPRIWGPFLRVLTRKGRRPPPIDPDLRRELAEYFAADNAALGAWLARDLGFWR